MGLIFDKNIAELYESWYSSPQGRAVDRAIEQLIITLLDPKPGDRILDIGCGTGNHLLTFSKMGLDVSGIDASPHMIEKAKERLGHHCTLISETAENLSFEDNEFDLATFINTLEFLNSPIQALREAGRVTNKKVFVGIINSLSWNGLRNRFRGYLGDPLFSRAKLYSLWQIMSLLRSAYGHTAVSWGYINLCSPFFKEMRILGKDLRHWTHYPFGSFLGISATMDYRMKTENLPLKIRLKKTNRSLIGAGSIKNISRGKRMNGDERGISVQKTEK